MSKDISYMRLWRSGPDFAWQREVLASIGAPLHDAQVLLDAQDSLNARPFALSNVGEGGSLWVATPACLGSSVADILEVLSHLCRQKARLEIGQPRETHNWSPEAASAMDLGVLAADLNVEKRARTMGRRLVRDETRAAEIQVVLDSNKATMATAASSAGLSRRTLHRALKSAQPGSGAMKP